MANQALVDKQWVTKGIDTYATEAILGTLAHYGAPLDEAAFRAAARAHYPLDLAQQWHRGWKGKGQFAQFPAAAAEELWRRLCPGLIAPTDVALALVHLLESAGVLLDNKPDGLIDARVRVVEAYLPKLPAGDELRRFLAEVFFALGPELSDELDSLSAELARASHDELAARVAAIEETIIPVRAGLTRAGILRAKGDREGALGLVRAALAAPQVDRFRLFAVASELLALEAFDELAPVLVRLADAAREAADREFGADVVSLLEEAVREDPTPAARHELRGATQRLGDWLLHEPR